LSENTSITQTLEAKHLLIAAPINLEESCFCIPAVRALLNADIIKELSILCHEEHVALWETFTPKAKLLLRSKKESTGNIVKEISKATDIDATLLWDDDLSAAKALSKAKIQHRYGLPSQQLAKYLTVPIELLTEAEPIQHRVQYYLKPLSALGIQTRKKEFFPSLRENITEPAKRILIVLSSSFGDSYEWPIENFNKLISKLNADGNYDLAICDDLSPKQPKVTEVKDDTCTEVHISSISVALETLTQYDLCLSSDGHIPHLASLVGTPCLTLFGPNEPIWKRPLGTFHEVIREHVACSPCFSAKCVMDLRCQNEVTVEMVYKKIRDKG